MFRRGNLVTFWRPFVVALIVLLALVLWLGSSDTQVLIHKLKSKMRGELPSWILGCLCMIWWKWKIPGVKMRRLCRPGWSSLGNRGFASRGSADLPLLGVGPKLEQFPLYFGSFSLWGCSLFEGDRTFAGSSPATSRNHGYWVCQQGWHWLLNADINVNSADRVNHCQKQTWYLNVATKNMSCSITITQEYFNGANMMFLTAMGVAAAVQAAGLHRRIALGSVGLLIVFNFKLGGVFMFRILMLTGTGKRSLLVRYGKSSLFQP